MTIFPVTKFGLQMSFHIDILVFSRKVVSVHFFAMNVRHLYMDREPGGLRGGGGGGGAGATKIKIVISMHV